MTGQNLKSFDKPSLYVHIAMEGDIFLLPSSALLGTWVELVELKEQLGALKKQDGQLFVSSDSVDENSHADIDLIFDLIDSYSLDVHPVDPHPAVRGYRRSYLSYVSSAISVAEIDVEGSEELLEEARENLSEYSKEDLEYKEAKEECLILEDQLEFAKYAHKRLLELELDICTEIKTVIQ